MAGGARGRTGVAAPVQVTRARQVICDGAAIRAKRDGPRGADSQRDGDRESSSEGAPGHTPS